MFRNPTTDLIVVLVIVLLILGPKRLPGLGRSLGTGMKEFKDSITGDSDESESEDRPAIGAAPAEKAPSAAPAEAPASHDAGEREAAGPAESGAPRRA